MSLELKTTEMPVNVLPQDIENMTAEEIIQAPDDIFEEAEMFFMREVMNKINLIYLEQGIKILMSKYYPISAQGALAMLVKFQYHGKILLVANGYIVTKNAYLDITNDRTFSRGCKGKEFKISHLTDEEVLKSREKKEAMDCLWLVCDMYYKIENLMIGETEPWNISFTVPDDGAHPTRQFFVAKWNAGDEIALSVLLRSYMTSMLERDKDFWERPSVHKSTRMLLVLDSKEQLEYVPLECGINAVYIFDDKQASKLKLLKKFTEEEIWGKQYEC